MADILGAMKLWVLNGELNMTDLVVKLGYQLFEEGKAAQDGGKHSISSLRVVNSIIVLIVVYCVWTFAVPWLNDEISSDEVMVRYTGIPSEGAAANVVVQIDKLFAALWLDPSVDKFKAMNDVGIVVDNKLNERNAAVVLSPETRALRKLKGEENYSIVRGLYHYRKKKQNRVFLNRDFIKVLYGPMMESTNPDLILPATLNRHERRYAHMKAGEYGWRSLSHGQGNDRRIHISIGATTREEQRIVEEATVAEEHDDEEEEKDKFKLSELDWIIERAGIVLDYRVDPTKTKRELRDNSDTKEELKRIAKVWMENVLSKAHIYTSDVGNSKVVVASDIIHALELTYGRCVLGYGSTVFKLPVSNHSIYKVLRQLYPFELGIRATGMQVVSDALAFIFSRIMDQAIHLSSSTKLKTFPDDEKVTLKSVAAGELLYEEIDSDSKSATRSAGASARTTGADAEVPIVLLAQSTKVITAREIQSGVRFELPGELAKHAVREGTKAVAKYQCNDTSGDYSSRSGLQLSVVEVAAAVADLHPNANLSIPAVIYLTAVLEYMSAKILKLSLNLFHSTDPLNRHGVHIPGLGRRLLSCHYVVLAIRGDEELNKQFRLVEFPVKYVRNMNLLLNNFFKELFKELFSSRDSVSKKALNVLQISLESYLVKLLEEANLLARSDGRVDVVQPRDLQIALAKINMAEGPK